jgi:peptidyl-prolyl cis-trans isomerase B (cyclophilin B)
MMKAKLLIFALLSAFAGICSAAYPRVTLHVTGAVTGDIVLEIYTDKAPVTAANFINYVQTGFYNGLIFHRVVNSGYYVIQGGGFDTGLVQRIPGPAIINESSNRLSHVRGTIAMARTMYADSATSQFFINQQNNTFWDYGVLTYTYPDLNIVPQVGYCVFGAVVSGMSVVDAIVVLPTATENGMTNVPVNDVIIQTATVTLNAPVCATKIEGDVDGDCNVDFADFVKFAQHWLSCNSITICN